MDKTDLLALISNRSPKLKAIRQQAANGNNEKKKLYMAALKYLLQQRRTQASAYDQITELFITASPYIVKQIDNEIVTTIIQNHHSSFDEYIILWEKMFDGSTEKKQYPNLEEKFKCIKIKNRLRELDNRMKNYLLEFEKNYNQKHDERVQFFEDFEDSVMSDSVLNESQLMNVVYLSIMEVKAARKKLTQEKLTDEALDEQLLKLKHFLTLNLPDFLRQNERQQFVKERQWALQYLEKKQEFYSKNPNISLNQTMKIEGQQQRIEQIRENPKPRMFKNNNNIKRQFFEDDIDMDESKSKVIQSNNNFTKALKGMSNSPTPVKLIDPRFVDEEDSHDASLQIHNGLKPLMFGNYRKEMQNKEEPVEQQQIVVRKIKPQDLKPLVKAKPIDLQDFSVTENYFNKGHVLSPRLKNQSMTMEAWASPTKNSKFKLSQFTSEKKVRKETAPRDQLSVAEPHVIQPYLKYFQILSEYGIFRRHCFENSYTIMTSPLLTVNCLTQKQINSKVRIELVFTNNFNQPLEVSIVYKVPQCFTIEKRTKIAKRFQLQSNIIHAFCLGAEQFPLEPCLISLKAKTSDHQYGTELQIPFSLTILNFLEYEFATEEEWVRQWNSLSTVDGKYFFVAKHIEVDRLVIGDEIDLLLKNLCVRLAAVSGYSVQDYGCICFYPVLNNLRFLLHISVRVDNIVSLEVVSARVVTKDQRQFIEYCLNIWMMLLGKLYL